MADMEKVIKELESLRDICNAKSDMTIGKGKIAWAGYANTADDAIVLLKDQPEIVRCKDCKYRFVDGDNVRFNMCLLNHNKVHPDDWFCADGKRQ